MATFPLPFIVTQADVERVMGGSLRLIQLCLDPVTSGLDATTFATWRKAGNDRAIGVLQGSGWSIDQIIAAAAIDETMVTAAAMVVAGYLGSSKPEFMLENGTYPFAWHMKEGLALLKDKERAEERSPAEEAPAVGTNPRLRSTAEGTGKKYFVRNNLPGGRGGAGPGGF